MELISQQVAQAEMIYRRERGHTGAALWARTEGRPYPAVEAGVRRRRLLRRTGGSASS